MYPEEAYAGLTPEELEIKEWVSDSEYQEHTVSSLENHTIGLAGGSMIGVDEYGHQPVVGLRVRLFGKGFGYPVRGIVVETAPDQWEVNRYRTPKEAAEDHWDWKQRWEEEQAKIALEPIAVDDGKHFYTNEMRQISGFGGGYERACRSMVLSGVKWLEEHPDADPRFKGLTGVYGLIDEDNEDAKSLSEAIVSACPDCSGAMHHASVNHVMWIKQNGWDKYVEDMQKPIES